MRCTLRRLASAQQHVQRFEQHGYGAPQFTTERGARRNVPAARPRVVGVDSNSMGVYRRILLAVDLTTDSQPIAERAKAIAAAHSADLDMLHVVEPLPLVAPLDSAEIFAPTVLQTQDEIVAGARQRLAKLAADVGLATGRAQVIVGNTQIEILRAAREHGADLIVLGSRERHGLSLLVDFTEDAVLHKASCDVLAVRVKAAS